MHVTAEAERLGLDIEVATAPHGLAAATAAAHRVLDGTRPSAVFCFSDTIAYGVYAAAAELGLSIPGDVSVMGYDDHPMSGLLTPGLTTVDWDIDGIVKAAVRLTVAAADGGSRRRRVVQEPTLRERGSISDLVAGP